ncbi:MAG: hypothetical protein ACI86X_001319 [Moritella sp.]|jgi:hypothetical protein
METLIWLKAIWVGIGATLIMDLWALLQKRLFGIPSLDYALVARWVLLIPSGQRDPFTSPTKSNEYDYRRAITLKNACPKMS